MPIYAFDGEVWRLGDWRLRGLVFCSHCNEVTLCREGRVGWLKFIAVSCYSCGKPPVMYLISSGFCWGFRDGCSEFRCSTCVILYWA